MAATVVLALGPCCRRTVSTVLLGHLPGVAVGLRVVAASDPVPERARRVRRQPRQVRHQPVGVVSRPPRAVHAARAAHWRRHPDAGPADGTRCAAVLGWAPAVEAPPPFHARACCSFVRQLDLPALGWKPLVGDVVTASDLSDIDRMFAASLHAMSRAEFEASPAWQDRRFTATLSDCSVVELVPGGTSKVRNRSALSPARDVSLAVCAGRGGACTTADRRCRLRVCALWIFRCVCLAQTVTYDNRDEYLQLMLRARLHEAARQAAALCQGALRGGVQGVPFAGLVVAWLLHRPERGYGCCNRWQGLRTSSRRMCCGC